MLPAGSWALKSSQKAKRRWEGASRLPGWKEVIPLASLLDTQAACCNSAQTSTPRYGCVLALRPSVRSLTWVGILSGHPLESMARPSTSWEGTCPPARCPSRSWVLAAKAVGPVLVLLAELPSASQGRSVGGARGMCGGRGLRC